MDVGREDGSSVVRLVFIRNTSCGREVRDERSCGTRGGAGGVVADAEVVGGDDRCVRWLFDDAGDGVVALAPQFAGAVITIATQRIVAYVVKNEDAPGGVPGKTA